MGLQEETEAAARGDEWEQDENERRWLVLSIDPDVQRSPSRLIEQGYLEDAAGLRVRIVDGKTALLTRKRRVGNDKRKRKEKNKGCDLETARFLLESTPFRIEKVRHERDGWEIDYFGGPLAGLVLAEFEMSSPDEDIALPPWIHRAIEVTSQLTNRHLARMAYDLSRERISKPVRDEVIRQWIPRIVLTGGPCSGKSSVMNRLRNELKDVLQCVPEVATIVIQQVGAKPPVDDPLAMRTFQRTIYDVQNGFEKVSFKQARDDGKRAILLDRGTVDGAAYMPNGLEDLEHVCMTTVAAEYDRYEAVICLDFPPRHIYERDIVNNPARYETYEEATAVGERIARVWAGHPHFVRIASRDSWEEKYQAAREAILDALEQ